MVRASRSAKQVLADPAELGARNSNVPVNLVERVEIYRGVLPVRLSAEARRSISSWKPRRGTVRASDTMIKQPT